MLGGEQLRIAVPSKGRLRDNAIEILKGAGLRFRLTGRRLFSICTETETRIIFSNVQDIPVLVAEGVVDLGITGSDQVLEKRVDVIEWAGNLEIHVYPAGSLAGLGLKLVKDGQGGDGCLLPL